MQIVYKIGVINNNYLYEKNVTRKVKTFKCILSEGGRRTFAPPGAQRYENCSIRAVRKLVMFENIRTELNAKSSGSNIQTWKT